MVVWLYAFGFAEVCIYANRKFVLVEYLNSCINLTRKIYEKIDIQQMIMNIRNK